MSPDYERAGKIRILSGKYKDRSYKREENVKLSGDRENSSIISLKTPVGRSLNTG